MVRERCNAPESPHSLPDRRISSHYVPRRERPVMAKFPVLKSPRRKTISVNAEKARLAPADRGYDPRWSGVSEKFRKRHPFCAECERRGFVILASVVDHIIPVRCRSDLRLDWKNLQALCHRCHNGWKRRLEAYAISKDLVDMLPEWCADPSSRPSRFRLRKRDYAEANDPV